MNSIILNYNLKNLKNSLRLDIPILIKIQFSIRISNNSMNLKLIVFQYLNISQALHYWALF